MSCSLLANVGSSSNLCDLNAMRCHFIFYTWSCSEITMPKLCNKLIFEIAMMEFYLEP